jgi:hypothetical protein
MIEAMTEKRKEFWAQPDADMPKCWVVCKNPDNAMIVAIARTKKEAEALADHLNADVAMEKAGG